MKIKIFVYFVSSLIFICCINGETLLAQSTMENEDFQFKIECPVYPCDLAGKLTDSNYVVAPANAKFKLIDITEEYCVIRFYVFNKKLRTKYNYVDDDFQLYRYFRISLAQLEYKADVLKHNSINFSFGNVLAPIKVRSSPFSFVKDFMIGPTFGIQLQRKDISNLSCNILLGAGISSISLDSLSTKGNVKESQDLVAFSPSFGTLLQFGNAQVGVFMGFDILSKLSLVTDWTYAKKPWISFGIGYSLFNKEEDG